MKAGTPPLGARGAVIMCLFLHRVSCLFVVKHLAPCADVPSQPKLHFPKAWCPASNLLISGKKRQFTNPEQFDAVSPSLPTARRHRTLGVSRVTGPLMGEEMSVLIQRGREAVPAGTGQERVWGGVIGA